MATTTTTYLITGASRGIGLELTKQLLELPTSQVSRVFALTRSSPSGPLKALIHKHHPDRVVSILASVDDTESVRKAALEIETHYLRTGGLDVLINNAGISSFSPGGSRTVPPEQLADVFNVNVIGAQRMISAFLPLLEKGLQKKVVNISSSMGSIALCNSYRAAPSHAYKVSKAALHMLNAQYAMEHADAGFTFLCVSPGWLRTDLGTEYADFEVAVGVAELKRIILESGPEQNGKFLNIHVPGQEESRGRYDGGEISW